MEPLARKAAETVVMVIDDEGLYLLIAELMRALGDSQVDTFSSMYPRFEIKEILKINKLSFPSQVFMRRGSAYLVGFLFKNSKMDLSDEVPNLITTLTVMLTDTDGLTVTVIIIQ